MIRELTLAVAVVAFLVAACGGQEASLTPAPSAQSGQPEAMATPSPPPADGQPATPVAAATEFETIETGQLSGIGGSGPQAVKIDTQEAWEEFWSRHKSLVTPVPPLPAVDFSREMVIAVLDHQEVSGGFRLEITGMEMTADGLEVRVSKVKPGPRCIVAAAISQPFHIVRTSKSDRAPQLAVSEETYSCE
ncbi:MAG: protease complex subunit PrcB family protein [Dehalococcoidia bacterium]